MNFTLDQLISLVEKSVQSVLIDGNIVKNCTIVREPSTREVIEEKATSHTAVVFCPNELYNDLFSEEKYLEKHRNGLNGITFPRVFVGIATYTSQFEVWIETLFVDRSVRKKLIKDIIRELSLCKPNPPRTETGLDHSVGIFFA